MKAYRILILLFLFLMVPLASYTQDETETCICNYNTFSDEEGNHKVKDKFILTFLIDKEKEVAYIIGNQGSDEVLIISSTQGGLSFIEVTAAGNIMVTTIDSKGRSVHSRNTVIGCEMIPTQYYGNCEFK